MKLINLADLDAERSLLSCLMLDAKALDKVAREVSASDFSDAEHGRMFQAMQLLAEAGKPLGDVILLQGELRRMHIDERLASSRALAELMRDGVAHHEVFYARRVRSLARLRRLFTLGAELQSRVTDPAADPVEAVNWVTSRLDGMASGADYRTVTLYEAAMARIAQLDAMAMRLDKPGASIGLSVIDNDLGGFLGGEMIVLAARPGCGKTALALQAAINNAIKGRSVLIVSIEMTSEELGQRALSGESGVNGRRIRAGVIEEDEREAMRNAARALDGLPVTLWAPAIASLSEIRAVARIENAVRPLGLLIIDYLQLVDPADRRAPRHEQVAAVSRGIKSLAKELQTPILALAQLTREAGDGAPRLHMLRESGSIEQDADAVLALHVPDENDRESVELITLKNRHGAIGKIPLRFIPHETRFADSCATEWAP